MGKLAEIVVELLKSGADPNDLAQEFEAAVLGSDYDWALFGDGKWRKNTVCSICGSWAAGICGHQNNPSQEIILHSEYKRLHLRKEVKWQGERLGVHAVAKWETENLGEGERKLVIIAVLNVVCLCGVSEPMLAFVAGLKGMES